MSFKRYSIARIAGDGIGPEVIKEASKILEAAGSKSNFAIEWVDYPSAQIIIFGLGKLFLPPL